MPKSDQYIFVLWGNAFEAVTATIFVTELRRVGLRVKVVGLTGGRSNDVCGLALMPDLTFEQARPLADRTLCLILPCTALGGHLLQNDPRLPTFLTAVQSNKAKVVIGHGHYNTSMLRSITPDNLLIYPECSKHVVEFARMLAASLVEMSRHQSLV